ncbi:CvpA family protein [Candidatus Pelagibacter sp.]|jgi:membrane protein required for colicin V production|nr:CvpA family protein [Candidatus Pelagibacter sp.]
MIDALKYFYEAISVIDLIFLIITILSVIKCYNKGFILSLLSASKWLLAYIITIILFPKVKPYFKNIIDSEYVLDVTLSLSIFVLVIFIILVLNNGISKTMKFVGLGRLDSIFGLFFGFIRSYVICVCLFSAIDIVYNNNKWPINADKSYTFPYLEKGSIYLIEVFPNEKKYQDSKDKIEEL